MKIRVFGEDTGIWASRRITTPLATARRTACATRSCIVLINLSLRERDADGNANNRSKNQYSNQRAEDL